MSRSGSFLTLPHEPLETDAVNLKPEDRCHAKLQPVPDVVAYIDLAGNMEIIIMGFYWGYIDYYNIRGYIGLYRDNGKENGNYYNGVMWLSK